MDSKKHVVRKLNTSPYNISSWVIFSDNFVESESTIDRLLQSVGISSITGDEGAACIYVPSDIGRGIVMMFPKKPPPSMITHEIIHALTIILNDYAGIPLNDDTDEAYAYMGGELTNQIYKEISKAYK